MKIGAKHVLNPACTDSYTKPHSCRCVRLSLSLSLSLSSPLSEAELLGVHANSVMIQLWWEFCEMVQLDHPEATPAFRLEKRPRHRPPATHLRVQRSERRAVTQLVSTKVACVVKSVDANVMKQDDSIGGSHCTQLQICCGRMRARAAALAPDANRILQQDEQFARAVAAAQRGTAVFDTSEGAEMLTATEQAAASHLWDSMSSGEVRRHAHLATRTHTHTHTRKRTHTHIEIRR